MFGERFELRAQANRAWARLHHSLHQGRWVGVERLLTKSAQDDTLLIHDDIHLPALIEQIAKPVCGPAHGDITPSDIGGAGNACHSSLARQSIGEPVDFSSHIIEYVAETKALKPPRGPRAQVSEIVKAVDDDRLVVLEPSCRLPIQLLEGDTDCPSQVLTLVFRHRQHIHQLRSGFEKPLDFVATNLSWHLDTPA
jgi:hypothetical protein